MCRHGAQPKDVGTITAVRVKTVDSMDTVSCDSGNEGFFARRGKPQVLLSDNGTNLKKAEK